MSRRVPLPRVPPPSYKLLLKTSPVKLPEMGRTGTGRSGARFIDRERLHKYSCGHSVEEDKCMFPPSHREPAIRINARDSDHVLYDVKCNFCEEKDVVSSIVVNAIKENILLMTGGILYMKETEMPDPVDVTWSSGDGKRRMIVITFWYPKEGGEAGEYEEVKATAYPARKLDGERSHRWEDIHVDMNIESKVVSINLKTKIQTHLNAFEQNWNELKCPRKPSLSATDLSSNSSCNAPDNFFDSLDNIEMTSLFQDHTIDGN